MVLDLAALIVFQDGNRAMADVIVELLERSLHDTRNFGPGPALSKNRLQDPRQEERLPEVRVALMRQQIAMMRAIRGQYVGEGSLDHALCLRVVGERGTAARLQRLQPGPQELGQVFPRPG